MNKNSKSNLVRHAYPRPTGDATFEPRSSSPGRYDATSIRPWVLLDLMRRYSAAALHKTQPSLASRPSLFLRHHPPRGVRPFVRLPCKPLAALFDDEDSEGELFAPYWGQQEVDWEDTPKDDNSLGEVWYEVGFDRHLSARVI